MQLNAYRTVLQVAMKYDVPLLFGGDIFHTPSGLSNELLSLALPELLELYRVYPVPTYAISGNHDQEGINSMNRRSPSYINTLANSIKHFHVIDFETRDLGNIVVHGIPYINYNQGYEEVIEMIDIVPGKYNILMNHADYKGQKDVNGVVIGKGENINENNLAKFDLVLSGHVHKAGWVRNNILSIGAPMAQRLSDMGGEFGYWTLKNGFKLKFHNLALPNFRYYEDESEIDNDTDYWIKKPKEVVVDENEMVINPKDLGDKMALIKQYCKTMNIKSRTKRVLLQRLIHGSHDD